MKLDMHCHTQEGSVDSKVPIEEYIKLLKEKGFDGMLVTDHDSYDGYRYYRKHLRRKIKDFVVLKGIEYDTLDAGHFIVIMPSNKELRALEIKGMPLMLLMELVHHHGGVLGPAHPCGEPFLSIFSTGFYKREQKVLRKLDFLEGYNCCEDEASNQRAQSLAREYNKPASGGSDSHKADCVGMAYTELLEDVRTEDQLIKYIRLGKPMKCGGGRYTGTLKDKLGFWNKFLVYGFFPYNKIGALLKSPKRRSEVKKSFSRLKMKR